MTEAKAFGTFIRIYSLFKSEHLSANIILTLHEALIRPIITYAYPVRELVADTHLLQLQRMRTKVLLIIENFPTFTPVHDLHTAFNIPYVYHYETIAQETSRSHTNHEQTCSLYRIRWSQTYS
jgi:hypothetical protein